MLRERMEPGKFKDLLEKRTKNFAVAIFKLCDALPRKPSSNVIVYQLGKSASSIGANYREANRAESRDDFVHKLRIALKEAAETGYWLEVLFDLYPMHDTIHALNVEADELRNLLQSICKSTGRRSSSGKGKDNDENVKIKQS